MKKILALCLIAGAGYLIVACCGGISFTSPQKPAGDPIVPPAPPEVEKQAPPAGVADDVEKQAVEPEVQQPNRDNRPRFFSSPSELAQLFSADGYVDDGWSRSDPSVDIYAALARKQITPGGYNQVGDVPNDISWFIESSHQQYVERGTLTARIFNPRRGQPVLQEFARLASSLFSRLSIEQPSGLASAIKSQSLVKYNMPYGQVRFRKETFQMGYGLILEIDTKPTPESDADAERQVELDAAAKQKKASGSLMLARRLLESNRTAGKKWLQRIVNEYPSTEAAKEAEELLKDL